MRLKHNAGTREPSPSSHSTASGGRHGRLLLSTGARFRRESAPSEFRKRGNLDSEAELPVAQCEARSPERKLGESFRAQHLSYAEGQRP